MRLWHQISHGVRALLGGAAADRRVDDEIEHFIAEAAAAYEADGLSPAEAQRQARLRVGSPLSVREEVRTSAWEHVLETAVADIRYGVRWLQRHPSFTGVVVATLALGIGAATAMISMAGPVLVQTLPFPQADRIRVISDLSDEGGRVAVAFGTFLELQQRSRSFAHIAVAREWQPSLTGSSTPERLEGRSVSADYFRTFGVAPRLGRDWTEADDVPNAPPVVILSDRLWRRAFAAAPDIIGRQITLDGNGVVVIGVMPARFEHRLMPALDVWRPLRYDRTLPSVQGREWGHHLEMLARLRDGVTEDSARAEVAQIARQPIAQIARPVWAAMANGLAIESLHADLTRTTRPAMIAVVTAASLLLLIAAVNVTNLLLGRDAERRAEFAMRTALGAGRWRVVRQRLTETMVLATAGGATGLVVSVMLMRGLLTLGPDGMATPAAEVDATVFATAATISVLVGLFVGVVPAWRTERTGIPHGAWQASSHHVTRRALVAVQVAFALVLLVGAGLLLQSLQRLFAISPGFDEDNALAAQVQVVGARFADPAVTHRYFEQILEAVQRVPGVVGAGLTSMLPLGGQSDGYGVVFESQHAQYRDGGASAFRYAVSPDYFETMGIPLRRGRTLTEHDRADTPLVAVISESLARSRFPGGDAIGQRLHVGPADRPWFTVVGVAGDVKQSSLDSDSLDAVYVRPAQWHFADQSFWLVIRAREDVAQLTPSIRAAIWSVDKAQPIVRVATLETIVANTARERRFALLLFQAFGLAALLLTAVGIYGVVSSGVHERTREIGVRTALGASAASIMRMVLTDGAAMAGTGIVIGLLVAVAGSQGLTPLLFGISRFDVISYAAVAVTLAVVTAVACWLPARRATRIDPAMALRAE